MKDVNWFIILKKLRSDDDSEITMRKTEKETAPSSKNTGLELIQSFDFDNLLYVKAASGSTCLFGDSDYVFKIKKIFFYISILYVV